MGRLDPSTTETLPLALHQPDIWGLTKGMLQRIIMILLKTIPRLYDKMSVGARRAMYTPHKKRELGLGDMKGQPAHNQI
jgi:hypothetical protein